MNSIYIIISIIILIRNLFLNATRQSKSIVVPWIVAQWCFNVTRREIILRTRYVIIADRRPIAPINARIFALKLRLPVAGAKTSPNRWVIDTKVHKGWAALVAPALRTQQLQSAGSRVQIAPWSTPMKLTRELFGIDEKRSKLRRNLRSSNTLLVIPPARTRILSLAQMIFIFLYIYHAKVRSEIPSLLLALLLTKSFNCNIQIIINSHYTYML